MPPSAAPHSHLPQRSVARPVANLGNTCYMNAVLQALAHAPELCVAMDCQPHSETCPKALGKNSREASPSDSPAEDGRAVGTRKSRRATSKMRLSKSSFCALCAVEFHLKQVHDRTTLHPVAPNALVNGFIDHVAPWFKIGVQEDSHEFLRVLIDSMQNSCKQQHQADDEDSDDQDITKKHYPFLLFSGKVESTVTCTKCKASSSTLDPIEDIGLDVTAAPGAAATGSSSRSVSMVPVLADIQSAFSRFTRKETLEGYKCEKCHLVGQATKQTCLYSIPPILTLHLKRFSYGSERVNTAAAPTTRRGGRSELSQLSTPSIHPMPVFASRSGSAKIEGHVKFDITFDLKPYLCESLQAEHKNMICRLFAVIVHNGNNSHSGHYIAYVRSLAKNEWWKMDDGRIEGVSLNQVMSAEAYMLFYRVVQHPISSKFEEECKRKFSDDPEVRAAATTRKPEASRKRAAPAATEPPASSSAAKKPKQPQLPDPEEWFQSNTNIPPALIDLIRRAQELVSNHVELTPECLNKIQTAAHGSLGAPPVDLSEAKNISSMRERLHNLFYRLAEYLDDPNFLKPRKKVAIVEPDDSIEEDDGNDAQQKLELKASKIWKTPAATVKEGNVVKIKNSDGTEVPIYLRSHLMDCLHKLNEFSSKNEKRLLVLSGLPGCGKTCLATLWARMQGTGAARVLYLQYYEKGVCSVYELADDKMQRLKPADKTKSSLLVVDVSCWLKRHLSSPDTKPYDICIVDGFRSTGASADLTPFVLMNDMLRKTALVTSDDIDTEGVPEDKLSLIAMDSWTLEDHRDAAASKLVSSEPVRSILQEDYAFLCNGDALDDFLSADDRLEEAVAAKFHYAGGSARYMYSQNIEALILFFEKQFDKVNDWNAFAQGSLAMTAAKSLMQRFAAKGEGKSSQRTPVSKYVLVYTFEQCRSTTFAATGMAAQCTDSSTLKDWSFVLRQLSMLHTALEGKVKGQTCVGNEQLSFTPTSEVHFDGQFLSNPISDEAIIWCFKWNQGSFDVAFYSSETLVTVLFAVEKRHSLKLHGVKQLRESLVSMKVPVERVVHMVIVGDENWQDFDYGPVRGAGKASRRSEFAFNVDVGRAPKLGWRNPAGMGSSFETEKTIEIYNQK